MDAINNDKANPTNLKRLLMAPPGSRWCTTRNRIQFSRCNQPMTAAQQITDFGPTDRRSLHSKRDPAVLADIWGGVETRILQEDLLQFLFDFHRKSQLAFVLFEYRESLSARLESRMSEA